MQAQSIVSSDLSTANRYFGESNPEYKILIFTREYEENNLGASSYIFPGQVHYIRHTGNKQVSIIWKLIEPIQPQYLEKLSNMLPV